jgi:hypothetical protein
VDVRAIEAVREKSVLNSSDLSAIDAFVADAVEEVLRAQDKDFATMAKTRSILISRQKSGVPNQKQYAQQFLVSAKEHITAALKEAGNLPQTRCAKVRINLFIMAHALNHETLVPMALPYLSNPSKPVSYWATQLATCQAALALVNTSSPESAQLIAALNKIAPVASPEALSLIIPFAGQINTVAGQDLILAIADARIKKYADQTVTHELADISVLSGLCAQLRADSPNKTPCAQRFAQLLSYVIQRFAKTQAQLTSRHKEDLISIIVETEEKCLTKLTGQPETALRRAIEREDMTGLMAEHDRLLGSATENGTLPDLLHFTYPAGNRDQNFPLSLKIQ